MEKSAIEMFINEVDVKRCPNDDCEYEVCDMAMKIYTNNYHCYNTENGWEIGEKTYSKKTGYRETKKLYRKDKVLTADILTSIKSIWKILFIQDSESKGREIKERILNDNGFMDVFPKELQGLQVYIKAFAIVYYWCGNMMPVACNFLGGRYGADNWKYKMEVLIDFLQNKDTNRNSHSKWKNWIDSEWKNNPKDFIEKNYLIDCFTLNDEMQGNYFVKNIIESDEQIKSLKPQNLILLCNDDYALAKSFFVNHVKLIIQRSYRINKEFAGKWDEKIDNSEKKHGEYVKEIMEYVLRKAGMKEEEIINNTRSLF